jgi:glutamyl-tRNA synthetase
MGYLPSAMRNYLVRLGWAHGDEEYFTTEQAVAWFDLPAIGRSPARFDFAKLADLNGRHMRDAEDADLVAHVSSFLLSQGREDMDETTRARLSHAMPGLKARARTLVELVDSAYYIFASRPLELDEKAEKLLAGEARDILAKLTPKLAGASEWRSAALEDELRAFAEAEGLKLGKVAQPLRAALTGRATSPGVFDVLETLGAEESLARIAEQTGTRPS